MCFPLLYRWTSADILLSMMFFQDDELADIHI